MPASPGDAMTSSIIQCVPIFRILKTQRCCAVIGTGHPDAPDKLHTAIAACRGVRFGDRNVADGEVETLGLERGKGAAERRDRPTATLRRLRFTSRSSKASS